MRIIWIGSASVPEIEKGVCIMSNKPKITGIHLSGWGFLVLAVIVFFFWEPLLFIGGILLGSWLIYRNRERIMEFYRNWTGR